MMLKILRRLSCKSLISFTIFQIVFFAVSFPFLVFHGPFNTVRNTVVGISWNSLRHRYVARLFLPEKTILGILNDSRALYSSQNIEKFQLLGSGRGDSGRIEVYSIKGGDFTGRLMVVHDPLKVKVGYSDYLPKRGETVSVISKKNKAVASVNAGGFMDRGWTGTGGAPTGFIISNGKVVYDQLKNDKAGQDTVAFTGEGVLIVGRHSIEQLKKYGVRETVSFGPPLIVNGKPTITKGDGGWGIAPRTAVGQRENGEVLFLVIDGRSMKSFGATLKDVQDILLAHGAVNAANLDGGSSTTMYFNGRVINKPSDRLGERAVPSIFIVRE